MVGKKKQKKSKADLPTLFFSGKEPERQLFFLGRIRYNLLSYAFP